MDNGIDTRTIKAEFELFAPFYDDFAFGYIDDILLFEKIILENKCKKILELCCGTGRCCVYFAEKGYDVTGLDLEETMLIEARRKNNIDGRNLGIKYVKQNAADFELNGQKYDFIFSTWSSLQHLNHAGRQSCFKQVLKHLKPGGVFAIDESLRTDEELSARSGTYTMWGIHPFFMNDNNLIVQYYRDDYIQQSKILNRVFYQEAYAYELPFSTKSLKFVGKKEIFMQFIQASVEQNKEYLQNAGFVDIECEYFTSCVGTSKDRFIIKGRRPSV